MNDVTAARPGAAGSARVVGSPADEHAVERAASQPDGVERAVGGRVRRTGPRPEGAEKLVTLGQCARFFSSKATVRIVTPLLVLFVVLRLREGDWTFHDVLAVVAILGLQPFTEWVIHVGVLHLKPKTLRSGRVIDLHAAKKHRFHHLHPTDPHTSFVPLADLAVLGLAIMGVFWLVARTHGAFLTACIVGFGMLLTYEWTHFLIHTAYKPKGRYYRYIWRAHRWHHYRNEHYWMGVTVHVADHLLGTFPDKSEVPSSPTARTLGVEPAG
ncbi:MAG: sterol desaturase family protein [Acidimicrobiales bacterium]